ncbi:glycosyltransferase [Tabrizicola sp. KVB23]|uniref:Glycosyltransferase n=1 Tax=Fuscibacter oryzae TaxID=2803939 RepID=A0A8J7MSB2_9RHOB|nr:ceramide glucosyltransferase [Fuscibacter oryzae]MBL4927764.1 glycosyltransferase [Fuscibacter oryzae]
MGLLLAATGLLFAHLATVGLGLAQLRRPLPRRIGQPPVTLLRPVCGSDPFDEETLRSSFTLEYPQYEVIFCAPNEADPAVALCRRLMAQYPHVPARLLTGLDALTNPKLANLAKGWRAATYEWVCMTDSNLLLPPDYLTTVTGSWAEGTGLVSCPPVGVRPADLGGHLECAFLNGNQARLQLAAARLGFGFAQGKTLFWSKPALEAAGGIAALGRHLAEDVTATRITREQGLRVSLPPRPWAQPIGQRSLRAVWNRQLRWSRVRRDGFPLLFLLEPLNGALLPAALAFAATGLAGGSAIWPLAYLALWYGAEIALCRAARWPLGLRGVLALPLRDALLPVLWLATFLRRGIEWRGNAMAVPSAAPTV